MQKEPLIQPYEGKFSSILLFGPPGAGKGALGKFLASAGTQYHLSSGDIFRSLPAHSPAGKLFYSYASKGLLIPDDATIEIWRYYVHGLIATNAYFPENQDLLLEGLPRTKHQAEILSNYITVKHVIILDVPNLDDLYKRMQKKARQEGRFDELDPKTLQKQLDTYNKDIEEILPIYPKHLRSVIDASQRPLDVLKDVLVRLSHVLSHGPKTSD